MSLPDEILISDEFSTIDGIAVVICIPHYGESGPRPSDFARYRPRPLWSRRTKWSWFDPDPRPAREGIA